MKMVKSLLIIDEDGEIKEGMVHRIKSTWLKWQCVWSRVCFQYTDEIEGKI